MIIAIDGPAASGKGTVAKRLARHFNLPHLDTGLLYRATAHALLAKDADLSDAALAAEAARALKIDSFDEEVLRGRDVAAGASVVGAIPAVREALFDLQQVFARQPGGAVLDGRDIGTVISPDADVKIFVTADPEVRATRRALEHARRGEDFNYEDILADIRRRDEQDASRAVAPLKAAEDAHMLDTSLLDVEASFERALAIVGSRSGPK